MKVGGSFFIGFAFWAMNTLFIVAEDILRLDWARGSGYFAVTALISVGLSFSWLVIHARENDVDLSRWLKLFAVLVAPVALTYYKFRYYGFKGGLVFLSWIALALVASIGALETLDRLI